jgi:predicted aspartyl protease
MNGQSLAEFMGTGNDRQRWFCLRAASQWAIAIMLTAALQVPGFPQSSKRREIPFENSGSFGLVLVKVEVNGRPGVLIVDTAANRTIISSELAEMGPRTLNNLVSTRKGSGLTGTGTFARVTLKLAHITWRDHQIVVMDTHELSKSFGQKIDGLLGMDFFSEFEPVVVDLRNHKLTLEP